METIEQLNEKAKLIGLHETYHATEAEALENARVRSTKSNRVVYVFKTESAYMVCVHGVLRIGHSLVKKFTHGV